MVVLSSGNQYCMAKNEFKNVGQIVMIVDLMVAKFLKKWYNAFL